MNKKRLALLGIAMIVCTYVGLAFAAEVRKGGANDLSFATPNQGTATTWSSGGGATVTYIDAAHIPFRNSNNYVDDLVDGGYDLDIKPANITGDGTDSITGFNIPLYVTADLSLLDAVTAWVDVRAHGAVGDGTTDDTAALAAALTAAAGKTLFIPNGTFTTTAELLHNAATGGPITIMGVGAGSILKITGATNTGIHITGTAGVTGEPILIKNIKILNASSSTSSSAIHLDGIAIYSIQDVIIDGNNSQTYGIRLTGSQQGQISGGYITKVTNGIYLEDSGAVSSNGCDLHGVSLNASGTNIYASGIDDVFIRANHLTGADIGIDIVSNSGPAVISYNHIEQHITAGVRGTSAKYIYVFGNGFTAGTDGVDVSIVSGGEIIVQNNLFTGSIVFATGTTGIRYINNLNSAGTSPTFTDNSTSIRKYGNTAEGAGPTVFGSTNFDEMTINARGSPGDMLTMTGNAASGGNWGFSALGSGTGEVYLKLHGPVISGRTDDSNLYIKSAVAGTTYFQFNAGADMKVNTAGKGVILTNAADNVTKRVRLNDDGDGLVFEDP